MANKVFDDIYIRDIAEAIRYKNGLLTQKYKISQMAEAIREINSCSDTTSTNIEQIKRPLEITNNGTYDIFPSDGYDAMAQVIVDIQVPKSTDADTVGGWSIVVRDNGTPPDQVSSSNTLTFVYTAGG